MTDRLRAKATLDWVDHPTMLSQVYIAIPDEIHDVYSEDGGKTWYVPFGVALDAKWFTLVTDPKPRPKRKGLYRWIFGD
jgi:hypothetical protein